MAPAMTRGAALLALQLLRGAHGCINAAGDGICATYVGSNCDTVLAGTLTVGDVCEKACGRCGTLLEAGSEAACWSTTTFADCCTVAAARPASDGSCTTAECADCWTSPYPAGLFETCCLDQDPCRNMDCGHGTCVVDPAYTGTCHCDPGWKGADGKEGREAGAAAPFCNTWHGFQTSPEVKRWDSGDYYTRSEFLGVYPGSAEWDAAAGLEGTCWDGGDYTHAICCSPADGTGDTSCWAADASYSNCLCVDPCDGVDCGTHGSCDSATGTCVCLTGYTGSSCETWDGYFTPEKRTDTDGFYYTKADFDTAYGADSDSRWAAQAGNHEICWDGGDYTYAKCCSPLDGTGNTDCWTATHDYTTCQCVPPTDCVGSWSACGDDCTSTYSVTTAAANGGLACEAADGETKGCDDGTDQCQLCASGSGDRTGYVFSCADSDAADADGANRACTDYRGDGCDAVAIADKPGATVAPAELMALCPLSCGICSGEFRQTGGSTAGCLWDTDYPYSECCASSDFTNAEGASCAFGGKTKPRFRCSLMI
eukprot:COSAG04_NODE_1727_length_5793_cov_2.686512_8_plen_540_part_00